MEKQASFQPDKRLRTPKDYQRVKGTPLLVKNKGLLLLAKPNQLTNARLGLVVPKRCVRRAVLRNRIKRTLRESFRLNQALLKGLDIVAIARQSIVQKQGRKELLPYFSVPWKALIQVCHPCRED